MAEKIIDVHNLCKSFNKVPAVVNVTLQVEKGEIFGFLGPNGSGKTTTIRMLCGLLTPDAGYGYCLGFDILTQSDAIKREVGYMSQRFSLYEDLSLFENLMFIANIYSMQDAKNRVFAALEGLSLMPRKDQLAGQLSGGLKQRLALAAALLHEPKLLLLDEPTAGVDPKARRDFWDQVHRLATQGITTLVSTHYMDEAERCNRLAYIMKGKILVQGTSEEIVQYSKLMTWEIRGQHLADLAQQLQQELEIEQVISYGQTLHVSGHNQAQIEQVAKKYTGYNWQQIDTGLEDVFVNLAESSQEGYPVK